MAIWSAARWIARSHFLPNMVIGMKEDEILNYLQVIQDALDMLREVAQLRPEIIAAAFNPDRDEAHNMLTTLMRDAGE